MKRSIYFVLICFLFAPALVFGQAVGMSQTLPMDSSVTVGTLPNGLKYYIRENHKPEHHAELRLVVNTGSVLEDDDQQGLAHLCEHMAFDGTKHFAKQEIINYLQSIGLKFGADLNAYTSFDETVYELQIPTDTPAIVDKSFQVLEDWAHNVSYEDSAIDKEKLVVIEEWRLGRGANARVRDKQFPILFKDSKYAERLPIGKHDILQSFNHDVLRKYYKTWYRPDLESIVAVGDFDKNEIEQLIRSKFSGIPNPPNEAPRPVTNVPDMNEALFSVATDKEATSSTVSVDFKLNIEPEVTVADYRHQMVEDIFTSMFNDRLEELTKKADAPFLGARTFRGRIVRKKDMFSLSAGVKDGGIVDGLRALLAEAKRVKQFGFTQTELDREKKTLISDIDQQYNERDKTQSVNFVGEYVQNYLYQEPSPGIAYERMLQHALMDGIALNEVNALIKDWMPENNCVVLASAPEKDGLNNPTEDDLKQAFKDALNQPVMAYVDKVLNQPLLDKTPTPGKVISEKTIPEIGVTEWQLSNGTRVILKPTDFKNDEILFTSFAPGGSSNLPDSLIIPGTTADELVDASGLGAFSATELQKSLAGKIVGCSPSISDLYSGVGGSASPKDIQTMFEMIYAYYTEPRIDSDAASAYITRKTTQVMNRSANPQAAWQDTLTNTLSQYNIRRRPWTPDMLKELNPQKSLAIYKNLYSDASGTTFIFVGSFKNDAIKPLIEQYIGGLPSSKTNHQWKDNGIVPPNGVISKVVHKGVEPKGFSAVVFTGPYDYSLKNNHDLVALCSALQIKMLERLRMKESGVYFVQIQPQVRHQPRDRYGVVMLFPSDPARESELIKAAFDVIDSVKQFGIDSSYVEKTRTEELMSYQKSLKLNGFWQTTLQDYYENGMDPAKIMDYPALSNALTPSLIKDAANKYLRDDNYVQVTLVPDAKQ